MVDLGQLDSPASITVDNPGTATESIYGLVYEPGVTDAEEQGAGIVAQLGYGADGSLPDDNWTWVDATYDSDVDDEPDDKKFDKYVATLTVSTAGTYDYAYRFRLSSSSVWLYADLDGNNLGSDASNAYSTSQAGNLVVGDGTSAPVITSLNPSSGAVGTQVTISGSNFGSQQGASAVTFNGVTAGVADSWTNAEISIKVPDGEATGPVVVTVSGKASNSDKIFTVTEPGGCFADVDKDGDVDIVDIQKVAGRWGKKAGDDGYDATYDVDNDGDIDIVDIQKVAGQWGEKEPWDNCTPEPTPKLLANATPIIRLKASKGKIQIGETFRINVQIENAHNFGAGEFALSLPNDVFSLKNIEIGNLLKRTGNSTLLLSTSEDVSKNGQVSFGIVSFGKNPGASGDGILASVELEAQAECNISPNLSSVVITDKMGNALPFVHDRVFSIKVVPPPPKTSALLPNYPNPFNPETWMPYQLAEGGEIEISIYAMSGKLIQTIYIGYKEAGYYHSKADAAYWDGKNQTGEKVASGMYFYHLKVGNFSTTRKLLLAK